VFGGGAGARAGAGAGGGSLDGIGHGLEWKGKNCALGRALYRAAF